jgi:molybdenum cofactor cytidylyltransferase
VNSLSFRSLAIIPAAGESRRMGQPKLLLPWGEKNVIKTVIGAWQASRVERVLVVVHPADQSLAKCCRAAGVEVVVPDVPPPDMRASLCAGLKAIDRGLSPAATDVFLVAPADMPDLSPTVIDLLLTTHQPEQPAILIPTHAGKHGHPVLLPWGLSQAVWQLPETSGLNALFSQHEVREVGCSAAGVPEDLDTPNDYERLRQKK